MSSPPLIFLDPHPRTEAMVYTEDCASRLGELGRVETHFGSRAPDELVDRILPEMAIIVGQTAMDQKRIERAKQLRAIINVKGNWEPNIDYAFAANQGIHVLSAAPAMAPAVAEYCLGQAITLGRGLIKADRDFRASEEKYGIAGNERAYSLFDAKVGLIGCGNLGRALLPLLLPFTANISVHDPWIEDSELARLGVSPLALDELLAASRYLFILAGVTTENEGFLGRDKLELLAEDATVILASRAEVVDFAALCELCDSGRLRAAIDVFPEEPFERGHELRSSSGVHLSAHLAGGINDSYRRIREAMLSDIELILAGRQPKQLQRAHPELAAISRSR